MNVQEYLILFIFIFFTENTVNVTEVEVFLLLEKKALAFENLLCSQKVKEIVV